MTRGEAYSLCDGHCILLSKLRTKQAQGISSYKLEGGEAKWQTNVSGFSRGYLEKHGKMHIGEAQPSPWRCIVEVPFVSSPPSKSMAA